MDSSRPSAGGLQRGRGPQVKHKLEKRVITLGQRRLVPQQQLQLRVEEAQQRPPADDLGVAVAQRPSAVASAVPVQTLGPRGQRDHLG